MPMGQNLTNLRNGTLALVFDFHILLVLRDRFNVLVRVSHLDILLDPQLLFFTVANGSKELNLTHNVNENQPVIFIDKR